MQKYYYKRMRIQSCTNEKWTRHEPHATKNKNRKPLFFENSKKEPSEQKINWIETEKRESAA